MEVPRFNVFTNSTKSKAVEIFANPKVVVKKISPFNIKKLDGTTAPDPMLPVDILVTELVVALTLKMSQVNGDADKRAVQ